MCKYISIIYSRRIKHGIHFTVEICQPGKCTRHPGSCAVALNLPSSLRVLLCLVLILHPHRPLYPPRATLTPSDAGGGDTPACVPLPSVLSEISEEAGSGVLSGTGCWFPP